MGVLQKEFLLHGFDQPKPYHQLDLYQVVKQKFRFTSSKLDYICQALELGGKTKHQGHELWLSCMEDNAKGWAVMRRYNMNDVRIMERLFARLTPWIMTSPSKSMRKVAEMILKEGKVNYVR
jgi:hypothetical protein